MKFAYTYFIKERANAAVTAADRHRIAATAEAAAALAAAHDALRRALTEQIAYVMPAPTPQRAAIVQRACELYIGRARVAAERRANQR